MHPRLRGVMVWLVRGGVENRAENGLESLRDSGPRVLETERVYVIPVKVPLPATTPLTKFYLVQIRSLRDSVLHTLEVYVIPAGGCVSGLTTRTAGRTHTYVVIGMQDFKRSSGAGRPRYTKSATSMANHFVLYVIAHCGEAFNLASAPTPY